MMKAQSAASNVGGRAAASNRRAGFFHLCGSPIRTDKTMTYDEDETSPPSPVRGVAQLSTQQCRVPTEAEESKVEDEIAELFVNPQQLDLDNAKEARIPRFMSDWYESDSAQHSLLKRSNEAKKPLSHESIRMKDLALGRVIGEGAFGKVYQAKWQGTRVAVKVLIRQNLSDDVVHEFETEVRIMSLLHHPNICRLLGACLEPSRRALVVELVERGSLWHVLRANRRQLTNDVRIKCVIDTARGMQYLHNFERPILHRDMKSPNLLVEKDYSIKISDFGLARVKAHVQTMTGNCGTVQWMAPEVLGNRKYTEKADVYSFGIVVWEIFTGRCPYQGMSQIQAALSVLNHDLRPQIPSRCPRFFSRLMAQCWVRDPESRPTFQEIIASILERPNP